MVDESICLDIPFWEFSIILEHLPLLPVYQQILHLLLVMRTLAVWIWYPWLLLLSFEMLMNLALYIPRKSLNHLSLYHLGAQLDLCILDVFVPTPNSWDDRCASVMQNELLCPSSLHHRSPFSCFWLSSIASFSHFLYTAAFASGTFIAWGIGIKLCTRL